jgi:hypothetical protein
MSTRDERRVERKIVEKEEPNFDELTKGKYHVSWSNDGQTWVATCEGHGDLSCVGDSAGGALDRLVTKIIGVVSEGETAADSRAARYDPLREAVRNLLKHDYDGRAMTPKYGDSIEKLRNRVNGWHFSRESLTPNEYEMSYTAEQLLHTLDDLCGGYLH